MTRTPVEPSGVPRHKLANGVYTCGRFTIRSTGKAGKLWEVFVGDDLATADSFDSLTLAHLWCRRNNP